MDRDIVNERKMAKCSQGLHAGKIQLCAMG